jgi:hypothetical protein
MSDPFIGRNEVSSAAMRFAVHINELSRDIVAPITRNAPVIETRRGDDQ